MSAVASSGTASWGHQGLLELPIEIRLIVYDFLLRPCEAILIEDLILTTSNKNVVGCKRTTYRYHQTSPSIPPSTAIATYAKERIDTYRSYGKQIEIWPAILSVNKQMRAEASAVLYGQRLQFDCSPDGFRAFMDDRPLEVLGCITNIGLWVPSETGRIQWQLVCDFISKRLQLQRLHLHINTFLWHDQPWERMERTKTSVEACLELDWVQSLLMIQNLEDLTVKFDYRYLSRGMTIGTAFTELLKSRMLRARAPWPGEGYDGRDTLRDGRFDPALSGNSEDSEHGYTIVM
ncbi:MAG: hypothetical protein LQ351_002534 [Letrouitia transgressa]|nr:MAG: hypothetical protein LQ351_002534 [Letrouitia transgressa]